MHSLLDAYSTYIFDFDGTLADSADDVIAAMHAAIAAHNLPQADITRFAIGPPIAAMFQELYPDMPPAAINRLVTTFRTLYNASGSPRTRLFAGIPAVLDHLDARNATLCIATNKARSSAFPILERLGVAHRFACVMCSDTLHETLGRGMSKAEMIGHVLHTLAVPPDHTVMIGDSPHDIKGGHSARVHTLGVLYGYGRPEDIMHATPEAVVTLPDWSEYLPGPGA